MAKVKKVKKVKVVNVNGVDQEEVVEIAVEDQKHIDARDARVATVKAAIETARLARVELEKTGVTETDGAKMDREAKEAEDLEEASVLKVVENFSIATTNNDDLTAIVAKINEVIDYLNRSTLAK